MNLRLIQATEDYRIPVENLTQDLFEKLKIHSKTGAANATIKKVKERLSESSSIQV